MSNDLRLIAPTKCEASALTRHAKLTSALLIGSVAGGLGAWWLGALAVPAASGLAVLAVSDVSARRVSPRVMMFTGVSTILLLAVDSAQRQEWANLRRSVLVTAAVGVAMLGLWLVARGGVAFGDLLLALVAVLVPAWVSLSAALWMLLSAFIAAGAVVAARRYWVRSAESANCTVPFAAALLVGWVVALCSA